MVSICVAMTVETYNDTYSGEVRILHCTNMDHACIPGNEMAASWLCSVVAPVVATVVALIVACCPRPASVAAVTEMLYSVPALRP